MVLCMKDICKHFDFSSHCGRKELHEMVKFMKEDPLVLAVHGDQDSCKTLANDINEETVGSQRSLLRQETPLRYEATQHLNSLCAASPQRVCRRSWAE